MNPGVAIFVVCCAGYAFYVRRVLRGAKYHDMEWLQCRLLGLKSRAGKGQGAR